MSRCCCCFVGKSKPPSPIVIPNDFPMGDISPPNSDVNQSLEEITTFSRGHQYRISEKTEFEEKSAVIKTAGILGRPKLLKAIRKEFSQKCNLVTDKDYLGRTAIIYACMTVNQPANKWLLKKGADINAADTLLTTPLLYALQQQSDKIIKFLLTKGADFRAKDKSGRNSLHYAVVNTKSTESLRLLLKLFSEPHTVYLDNCGHSPMHYAVSHNNRKAVELLLLENENSTTLELLDDDNRNPLMIACLYGSLECVQYLMPKMSTDSIAQRDSHGCDSLLLSVVSKNLQLVEHLVESSKFSVDSVDSELRTPLHYATNAGHLELVKFLIAKGSQLLQDRNDLSAIHIATTNVDTLCLQLLLSHFKMDPIDKSSRSGFMWAVVSGNLAAVQMFVSTSPIDKNQVDIDGRNALHLACMGHSDVAAQLIKSGWSTYQTDKSGKNPLMITAEFGQETTAQLLITSGCDLSSRDGNGRTALHWSALGAHLHVTQLLLKRGLQTNLTDTGGRSALHCAAFAGSLECCKSLIHYGCVVDQQDNEGFTPLHWASKAGQLDVVKLLLDYDTPVNCLSTGVNRLTSVDLAIEAKMSEVEKLLRSLGGFTYGELRGIAAVTIQVWFKNLKMVKNKKSI